MSARKPKVVPDATHPSMWRRRLRERWSTEAMKPEITLMKKRGPSPVMSRRIFLGAQGKLRGDGSQWLMAQGTATRAATAADLASSTSRI